MKYLTIYARLPEPVYRRFMAYQASKGFVSGAGTIENLLSVAETVDKLKPDSAGEKT